MGRFSFPLEARERDSNSFVIMPKKWPGPEMHSLAATTERTVWENAPHSNYIYYKVT